jgi:hypothetical protein
MTTCSPIGMQLAVYVAMVTRGCVEAAGFIFCLPGALAVCSGRKGGLRCAYISIHPNERGGCGRVVRVKAGAVFIHIEPILI